MVSIAPMLDSIHHVHNFQSFGFKKVTVLNGLCQEKMAFFQAALKAKSMFFDQGSMFGILHPDVDDQ
jgi:hypothetical protein